MRTIDWLRGLELSQAITINNRLNACHNNAFNEVYAGGFKELEERGIIFTLSDIKDFIRDNNDSLKQFDGSFLTMPIEVIYYPGHNIYKPFKSINLELMSEYLDKDLDLLLDLVKIIEGEDSDFTLEVSLKNKISKLSVSQKQKALKELDKDFSTSKNENCEIKGISDEVLEIVKEFNELDTDKKFSTPFRAPGLDFRFFRRKSNIDINKAILFYMDEAQGEPEQEVEFFVMCPILAEEEIIMIIKDFIEANERDYLYYETDPEEKEKFVNFSKKFNECAKLFPGINIE